MKPLNSKRSKLINITLLTALLVFSESRVYAGELKKENINKQQETIQETRNLEFLVEKGTEIFGTQMEELRQEILDVNNSEQLVIPEKIGNKFLDRQEPMEYTEEELTLLATVIYAEAGICDDKELYRVANVVVNRVNNDSGQFEDTIKGVIYQEGQFTSVDGEAWNRGPTQREIDIAKDVLEGARIFLNNTYWFSRGHRYGDIQYKSEWHYFSGTNEF